MIKAIVYHNGEQIKTYEFDKSLITVGRLSQNDIPINSMAISRMHLKISYNWEKQAYFASDMNSLNGTYIYGEKITIDTPLENNVKLVSGQFSIILEFVGTPSFEEANNSVSSDSSAEITNMSEAEDSNVFSAIPTSKDGIFFSQVVAGNEEIPAKAFFIELNNKIIYKINKRVMAFGNAANDDFYIGSGIFASENMATLTVSDDGYLLQSNTMMGKFKVNGNKVSKCLLKNKDRVEFGASVFTFKLKAD
jgi:pSer/pThr/pTyr-binding forkhead associated (FHA) protein